MEFPLPLPLPEKIIIFMDTSADVKHVKMQLNDREPVDSYERLQKVIRMFIMNKEAASCNGSNFNEYALMVPLGGSPEMLNAGDFTDAKRTVSQLDDIQLVDDEEPLVDILPSPMLQLDVGEIIRTVTQKVYIHSSDKKASVLESDAPDLYLTRLIMFITRSRSQIKLEESVELKKIMANQYFYVDVVYLHEDASDENIVEVNWLILKQLNDLQDGRGYILEAGADVTDWHQMTALLLPNPILRIPMAELQIRKRKKITTGGENEDLPEPMDHGENEASNPTLNNNLIQMQ